MNRKGFTKVLLLIVIVLAVVVLVLQTGPKASINIKIQEWGKHWNPGDTPPNKESQSTEEVRVGNMFGPKECTACHFPKKPLKLVGIIDEHTMTVSFDEKLLTQQGELVNYDNPRIVSRMISNEEICFNTRTLDAGSTICLSINTR